MLQCFNSGNNFAVCSKLNLQKLGIILFPIALEVQIRILFFLFLYSNVFVCDECLLHVVKTCTYFNILSHSIAFFST